MKRLLDLQLVPVWVSPAHLARSAAILMEGHSLRAIAVRDGTNLVGILTADSARRAPETALVADLMTTSATPLEPLATVAKAALQFVDEDLDVAVVVDGTTFYGVVTAHMLLKELRRTWDPLTGLGWSDRLREWGIEQLSQGHEITILFVDLDSFGRYNKEFGHVVGDRVLKQVAHLLRERTDPGRDVLVRYGGDEFAIGTRRDRAEAERLANEIEAHSGEMFAEEAYRPISFSIGVAGGRRTHQRPEMHAASVYDALVNAASRESQRKKLAKRAEA